MCLIKSYTTISMDAKVGNRQKNKKNQRNGVVYYNAAKSKDCPNRTLEQVKNCHYKVTPEINLFSSWYSKLNTNRASGQSDKDVKDKKERLPDVN